MTINPPPCARDCPGRSVTCHAECEAYKAWSEAEQKAKKGLKDQRAADARFDSWRADNIVATMKYGRRRS